MPAAAEVDPARMMPSLDSEVLLGAGAAGVVARCPDWAARVLVVRLEAERRMAQGNVADSTVMIGLIGGAEVMAEDVAGELADTRVADVPREDLVVVGVVRGGVARVRHVEAADVTK